VADVFARAARAAGRDVFFLTGTDEHGLKVEQSAAARGVPPQQLADENSAAFRAVMTGLNISFDHFIRTTDAAHMRQVAALVARLQASGAVYLGTFEGWYDAGQEEYHSEMKAKDLDYKSPITGKPLVRATEENYYFRLSAYQEPLLALFEAQPDFVQPPARRNEMLGRLREGLTDVPISRTNFSWGIPMPGDERHVIYVWIDALLNYITALGLGEPAGEPVRAAREHYWPASVHVMAKEIAWFHAVIWPAMLMALQLPLPARVYAHAFWIRDGMKMSKSLGNFVDLVAMQRYTDAYGLDAFRYFLILDGPLGANGARLRRIALARARCADAHCADARCAPLRAARRELQRGAAAGRLQRGSSQHAGQLRQPRDRHGRQILRWRHPSRNGRLRRAHPRRRRGLARALRRRRHRLRVRLRVAGPRERSAHRRAARHRDRRLYSSHGALQARQGRLPHGGAGRHSVPMPRSAAHRGRAARPCDACQDG
jgi:hypothetical protein